MKELAEIFEKTEIEACARNYSKSTALSQRDIPLDFMDWLIEHGADIEARDLYGDTALMHHVYDLPRIKKLLALGANIQAKNNNGSTALHDIAGNWRVENILFLIEHGADVNAEDKDGLTPLAYALTRCSNAGIDTMVENAKILLASGAKKTPEMAEQVKKIGENFEFYRKDFNKESLPKTDAALSELYRIFEVTPVAKREVYDGQSKITVKTKTWQKQHEELWELLVPGSGASDTIQGEVIRITGKITDEFYRNGGINWDKEYRKLLKALPNYFSMGEPLEKDIIKEVKQVSKKFPKQADDDDTYRLSELAVAWVLVNPIPITLGKINYTR